MGVGHGTVVDTGEGNTTRSVSVFSAKEISATLNELEATMTRAMSAAKGDLMGIF